MEQSQWYYAVGNTQQGPVDQATLRQLIASGRVGANDLVWREGMSDWVPASTVAELAPAVVAPSGNGGAIPAAQYAPPAETPYAPPPPYAPPGPVGYAGLDPATQQLQSKATTAMVVGIISLVLSACICGPVGLGLGIWAWVAGSKVPAGYPFSGQGKAGFVCGIIGTILGGLRSLIEIFYVIGIIAAGTL